MILAKPKRGESFAFFLFMTKTGDSLATRPTGIAIDADIKPSINGITPPEVVPVAVTPTIVGITDPTKGDGWQLSLNAAQTYDLNAGEYSIDVLFNVGAETKKTRTISFILEEAVTY